MKITPVTSVAGVFILLFKRRTFDLYNAFHG
jgi:hypothetical protein